MDTDRGRRGQTEGIGIVLLTAVLVIVIGTFGVFYLESIGDESGARVALDVEVSPTTLTVTHTGGESLATDEVVVVVRHENGTTARYPLTTGTLEGSSPGTFDVGETWTHPVSATTGDRLRVLVVHDGTDSVPFDSTVTVRAS